MWCNDPVLTYLRASGYNAVRLPKADIRPLQIMTQAGRDLSRLGELATVFVPGNQVPLPRITADVRAAAITGQRTGDLSLGIGLSILGNILGAMGGSPLGFEEQYRRAKTIAFEFQDVLGDSVEVAELDKYLGAADVNPFSRHVAELLDSDAIYVTTATIKSKKFVVEARASAGGALDVSAPAIQDAIGTNVKVSQQGGSTSKLAYEGTIPLVFGFQAVRLYYRDGRYSAFRILPPEGGLVAMGGRSGSANADDFVDRFVTERAFVRLGGDG